MILTLEELCRRGSLRGKRVFIRSDLNVPQDDCGRITDDTRIRASLPGIRMAVQAGGAGVTASHLGRPAGGEFRPPASLAPVPPPPSENLGMRGALGGGSAGGRRAGPRSGAPPAK